VLKLTVASYYRPSGENIHRFRNSRPSDKWGVSPDKGMEVKLTPSEYVRWAYGRRDRDTEASAKGRRKASSAHPGSDAAKTAQKSENPKENEKAVAKAQEKSHAKTGAISEPSGPFVDKQLDKALEVIRAKLQTETKAKAA
jgi:carboxyl-terminal processing protease